MIDLEVGDTEIIARGSAGSVVIDVAGWSPSEEERDIGHVPVDATCSGYISKFQLISENFDTRVTIRAIDNDIRNVLDDIDEGDMLYEGEAVISDSIRLPEGDYRLKKTIGMITMYSLISGPSIVNIRDKWQLTVIPEHPTCVTFGFRDNRNISTESVTVPQNANGLAAALSYFRTGLRTLSPDRSFLTFRAKPPRIKFGDKFIPSSVKQKDPDSEIEIVCPKRINAVAATASAAYYLGAKVRTSKIEKPVLRIGHGEFEHPFSKMPDFQVEIGHMLRRVLWLDCVVRNAGPYGKGFEDICISDSLGIELDRLYNSTAEDRLIEYLRIDYDEISDQFPPWSLGVRINITPDDLKMLPDLARQLAIIYPSDINVRCQSNDSGVVTNAGPLDERLFGMSTSIDSSQKKAKDGYFYLHPTSNVSISDLPQKKSISISVVRNDKSPDDRFNSFLQERADGLEIPLKINRITNASSEEMISLLQEPTDYFVFVGETADECLATSDGALSIKEVDTIGAEFLLLDTPNSFDIGLAAVERGVRTTIVGNDSKKWDGIGPAPLVFSLFGFGMVDATWLACNYTDSTADVSVIGEGMVTHRAASGVGMSTMRIKERPHVSLEAKFFPVFPGTDQILNRTPGFSGANTLAGNVYTRQLSTEDIPRTIDILEEPIIYEDEVYWPDERFQLQNPVV